MSSFKRSGKWVILVLVLAVGAGAAYYSFVWRPRQNLLRFVALKNQAIALAENAKYLEADELFQQMAAMYPDEPLVLRNLAVVRVGQFERQHEQNQQGKEKEQPQATLDPQKMIEAVERLLKAEPNEAASHILAARAAVRLAELRVESDLPDPIASLSRAAELTPNDPAVQFELHELAKLPDYKNDKVSKQALEDAYKLQPRSLTLLLNFLLQQSDPTERNPSFRETVTEAKEVLLPLREIVLRRHPRVDVAKYLDGAQAAVDAGEWNKAHFQFIHQLVNIVRTTLPQRTDVKRLKVGALEYLRYELSDALASAVPKGAAPKPSDSAVSFAAGASSLPDVTDVRDVRLADVDLDGRLDLVVLHGERLTVFSRPRNGDLWSELLATPVAAGMQRVLAADLDRDAAKLPAGLTPYVDRTKGKKAPGDESVTDTLVELDSCDQAFPDFLLYGPGGICLVHNEKARAAEEASETGGLRRKLTRPELSEELSSIRNVTAALLVDFDHDQDLDMVLGVQERGVQLWRMLGNGTFKFENYSQWSTLPAIAGEIVDLALVDWDRDLYTDIFVIAAPTDGSQGMRPFLLHNLRHGQLLGEELGEQFNTLRGSRALVPVELDGNVSWDLAAITTSGLTGVLTTTSESGEVKHLRDAPAVSSAASKLLAWDYNNDTFPDLIAWSAGGIEVWQGKTDGFSRLDPGRWKVETHNGLKAVDCGDIDGDGDLDVVLAWADRLLLVDNQGGNAHRWLEFYVTGDYDGEQDVGANNSAIGTIVEVQTGERYQAQVITRQPVHVGLGQAQEADRVRLLFTNGIPRSAQRAKGNTRFCEKQVLGGSCPFVYCWDGERFVYFTDCLWAAPIGLQVAEGKMAPSRAWEYLLVPGERLKERNGAYDLQLTEELWEAAYFDQVKLIAVDHPADMDLYTNEKVGGPDIAAPKLHLVRQPRRPVAARDKHGRDVLSLVGQRDDDYLRGFDRHIKQGLVDEHFLELDLGHFETLPKQVTLFLTGWIYPTNTSINVNLSQHPDLDYPRLPYVQVADGAGGWKEAQAFMGFPGGKTKTIAVELPGDVFVAGQYQLRISTSAEIYWDDVFFTVDEEPVVGLSPLVHEHTLSLVSADLHYRGFSRELPRHPHAPLRFDYGAVSQEPKWPPMAGNFTRYGDVRPLLLAADDRMVVMGSGDEMTVRFRAPAEPPPPGWKRDFILYSVGWDKDADLNTVYGQTAEPLPYNAMLSYPYPPDQWYPDTQENRRYLETYQTRRQPFERFWRHLAP